MSISNELLKILACPKCKNGFRVVENSLLCKKCNIKYPIKGGIPILMVD